MLKKHIKKTQAGFTLIEIIAVLVILGILAAVAVPRFLDLQNESKKKALQSMVAAGQSQLAMEYSKFLLTENGDSSAAWHGISGENTNDILNNVSSDGWLDDANLNAATAGNKITITATSGDYTASGTFTDPSGN